MTIQVVFARIPVGAPWPAPLVPCKALFLVGCAVRTIIGSIDNSDNGAHSAPYILTKLLTLQGTRQGRIRYPERCVA